MDENKSKALAAALSQIEKQFGKGSIMRLGASDVANEPVETTSISLATSLAPRRMIEPFPNCFSI